MIFVPSITASVNMSSITTSTFNIYHGGAASGGGGGGHDSSCISTVKATDITLNVVEWAPSPTFCSVGCGRVAERGCTITHIHPDGTVYVFPKCFECWNSFDAYPIGYSLIERKVMSEVSQADEDADITKKRTNWLHAKDELDKYKVELSIERSKVEEIPIYKRILLRKNLRLAKEQLVELKNEYEKKDNEFDTLNEKLSHMHKCVITAEAAINIIYNIADDKQRAINYYKQQCELVTNTKTKLEQLSAECAEFERRIERRIVKVTEAELAAKCITRADHLEWLVSSQQAKVDKLKANYDMFVFSVKSTRERRIIDEMQCMTKDEIALKQQKVERLLLEIPHLESVYMQARIELERCTAAVATAASAVVTATTAFTKDFRINKRKCSVLYAASTAAQATSMAAYAAQATATTAVASAKVAFESATTDLKATEDELKRIKQLQKH